jgi:hypothetical protein
MIALTMTPRRQVLSREDELTAAAIETGASSLARSLNRSRASG